MCEYVFKCLCACVAVYISGVCVQNGATCNCNFFKQWKEKEVEEEGKQRKRERGREGG